MLRTHSKCGERRIALFHGARHSWELGYRNELENLDHRCPTFTYIPAISRPKDEYVPWPGETGHIQDVWQRKPLDAIWGSHPTAADSHVFLCGNPGMIENMLAILVNEGFTEHTTKSPGQIHLEKYW
jgi:ferredoxin--NADP+ reductase